MELSHKQKRKQRSQRLRLKLLGEESPVSSLLALERKSSSIFPFKIHGSPLTEEVRVDLQAAINNNKIAASSTQPAHASLLAAGVKTTENRGSKIPHQYTTLSGRVFAVHVSTTDSTESTRFVAHSVRHKRTHSAKLAPGAVVHGDYKPTVNDKRIMLARELKNPHQHHKLALEEYKKNEVQVSPLRYPANAVQALVVYNGELTKEECELEQYKAFVLPKYKHHWKVESVIQFGTPIMNVSPVNQHGLETGTAALFDYFHIRDSNTTLKDELLRRLPGF